MTIEEQLKDLTRNYLGYDFDRNRDKCTHPKWEQNRNGSQRWGEELKLKPEPEIYSKDTIEQMLRDVFIGPVYIDGADKRFISDVQLPANLIDKSFRIGTLVVHTSYKFNQTEYLNKHHYDHSNEYKGTLNIVIEENGLFRNVLTYTAHAKYEYDRDTKTKLKCTGWYIYDNSCKQKCIDVIIELFKSINSDELEFVDTPNEITTFHTRNHSTEIDNVCTNLSIKNLNYKAIIEPEIVKGVYKPTPEDIKHFYNIAFGWNQDIKVKFPIKTLGVHTIHLRGNAHFELRQFFDLTDVKVKGPKNVIKRYSYEDLCVDEKTTTAIKEEKRAAEEKQRKIAEDNKFTLVKQGVTIFESEDKETIIEFLEGYVPTDKGGIQNYGESILEEYAPILERYKVDRYELAYWGRFFKYECAGEICEINYETPNEHIDSNTLDSLESELENCTGLEDKLVEINFGWPERGGSILIIEKNKYDKYEIVIDDYDFE